MSTLGPVSSPMFATDHTRNADIATPRRARPKTGPFRSPTVSSFFLPLVDTFIVQAWEGVEEDRRAEEEPEPPRVGGAELRKTKLRKNEFVFRYDVGLPDTYYRHELQKVRGGRVDTHVPRDYVRYKEVVIGGYDPADEGFGDEEWEHE